MLTIREPMALQTQRPIQSIRQDMAERLQANYGLMRLPIRKEELLHITAEPPEVYFAEGDQISISTQVNNEIQQELRLDVINNLINRIMVAQTENFSYQDTVYISTILRKLGIRDEKLFMKQVFALQTEKMESHRLLEKYEENRELLQLLFEQEQQRQQEEQPAEQPAAEERRYYLHDSIFKRLETGKVYQDMRAFSRGVHHASQQIFRTEFNLGEQAALVQQFHLHELQQKITKNTLPLYYFHNNSYEFLQEMTEEVSQTLEEQISAAILLNLTDQSFALRQQQIAENNHYWYSLAGALFQTAENTWKRYEANLTEGKRVTQQMLQVLTEVSEAKHIEGDTIENIAAEYRSLYEEWQASTAVQQLFLQQNRIQEDNRQEISLGGGSYHLTQEELELTLLQQPEEGEEPQSPEAVTAEQLQRQLETFQQKNFENYRKITEIQKQQPRLKERKLDRKKAQQDALRALQQPNEVLMEYLTAEITDPVQESQRELEEKLFELFSDETKEIYRQYLQQHHSEETTFLQHIMAQPEESQIRQEVYHAMEQVQREEIQRMTERQMQEQTERLQPVFQQSIQQEIRQKLISLQEQQQITRNQLWNQPAELHWHREQVTEEILQQQMQTLREGSTIQRERILQTLETEGKRFSETRLYGLLSQETQEIYQEFQMQYPTEERNFLQYIMAQPEENIIRQDVFHAIERVQREEIQKQVEQQIQEYTTLLRPSFSENIQQEMHQKLLNLQEQQNAAVYQSWSLPAELYWQKETERETEHLEQMRLLHEETVIRQEQSRQTAEATERAAEAAKETLTHRTEAVEREEVFLEKQESTLATRQEQKLTELKQTMERELLKQQEHRAEVMEQQKTLTFRQVDLVHKAEEQILDEELLERLRTQQQRTKQEEHFEETTLQQNHITQKTIQESTHQIQTNQVENIEELIQQNVKKQLNHLSDQVYGKLEKKLQTERKRRGFS